MSKIEFYMQYAISFREGVNEENTKFTFYPDQLDEMISKVVAEANIAQKEKDIALMRKFFETDFQNTIDALEEIIR